MWEQVGNTATDTRRNAYQNKTGRDTTEHKKTKMPKVKTEKTEMREAGKKSQKLKYKRHKPGPAVRKQSQGQLNIQCCTLWTLPANSPEVLVDMRGRGMSFHPRILNLCIYTQKKKP